MTETPAKKMHNRILSGNAFSTQGVTADAFEEVAQKVGTLELPDVKRALSKLRALEHPRQRA